MHAAALANACSGDGQRLQRRWPMLAVAFADACCGVCQRSTEQNRLFRNENKANQYGKQLNIPIILFRCRTAAALRKSY